MSKVSTLVRILLAGSEGKTASAAWVDAAVEGGGFGGMSRQELFELDCEYRRHLRQRLLPRFWNVLVARYTVDPEDRVKAIRELCRVVASHAHGQFKAHAILAWAEPKRPGVAGKRSTIVLREDIYDMASWDANQGTSDRTMRRWRAYIGETLNELHGLAIAAAIQLLDDQELFEREVA